MPSGRQGSIHLFKFAGVDVFLHWSWFLIAVYEIQSGVGRRYTSVVWNIVEYLALFAIVLTHEFGHALACRQVGGVADHIVLWPLGGVAYVNPPPRPGATLWSIVAGPLVNVVLYPVLWTLSVSSVHSGWGGINPNIPQLLYWIWWINRALLFFNILPIFPLDGGQILRALLWFPFGRARSLLVATIIGFIGVAAFLLFAFRSGSLWIGAIAIFMLLNCWGGLKHSLTLLKMSKLPRRPGLECPACKNAPPMGDLWRCSNCTNSFDTFATHGVCPTCAAQSAATRCLDCGQMSPIDQWYAPAPQVIKAEYEVKP
jgi:Zn-dependent protease